MSKSTTPKNSIWLDVLNGNILTRDGLLVHLPYVFFLALIALIYIANGYMAESTIRELNHIQNEIKELRSEYITTKSELMYKSKQSELANIIVERGLKLEESTEPPFKIETDQNLSFQK